MAIPSWTAELISRAANRFAGKALVAGRVLAKKRRPELALACLRKAALSMPGREAMRLELAEVLSAIALQENELSAFAEAVPHFLGILDSETTQHCARLGLARLLSHSGYCEDALPYYESLLANGVCDRQCLLDYADTLAKLGRTPQALKLYRDVLPGEVDFVLKLARLESVSEDHNSALGRLRTLRRENEQCSLRITEQEVLALARSGELAGALALLETAFTFNKKTVGAGLIGRHEEMVIVVVCWGKRVLQNFLEVCVPGLLGPGQVPDIDGAKLVLYTSDADAEKISVHSNFATLSSVVHTSLVTFPEALISAASNKYQVANWCHQHAILQANLSGDSLVFISPDSILSKAGLAWLARQRVKGVGTVLISGPRVTSESAIPAILNFGRKGRVRSVNTLSIAARDLVKVILEHPHHSMRGGFIDSSFANDFWACVFSRVGTTGLLARQMHLHPLMVTPKNVRALPEYSLDSTYVGDACSDDDSIEVVSDSDDFCAISWSSRLENADLRTYYVGAHSRAALIAHLARRHIVPFNMQLLLHKIRFHAEDRDWKWTEKENESDALVAEIARLLVSGVADSIGNPSVPNPR